MNSTKNSDHVIHTVAETTRVPGLVMTGHYFDVPLDYSNPDGEKITVYAREVVAAGKQGQDLPWLLFLQGGPGGASPRPTSSSSWMKRATQEFRVLLLDQRGTGLSSRINAQTLPKRGDAQAQADYLKLFRADNIVRDSEAIRKVLAGPDAKWTALGQSYGGFCLATYLSIAPEGLEAGIFTGGISSLTKNADEVYEVEYPRVLRKNKLYYEMFPEDVERVREIVDYLDTHDVKLPTGGKLSSRRFQQLGMAFGSTDGFQSVHFLIEGAFDEGVNGKELSYPFLKAVDSATSFDTGQLYVVLQEIIYAQESATNWAAHRIRAQYPEFDIQPGKPVYFTGEMMYPWMFDEVESLKPLKEVANILAEYEGWPRLYDLEVLKKNKVPCVAAVYYNDMYVDREQSLESAEDIANLKLWITNEYEHDAVRTDGERVFDKLLGLLRGDSFHY